MAITTGQWEILWALDLPHVGAAQVVLALQARPSLSGRVPMNRRKGSVGYVGLARG